MRKSLVFVICGLFVITLGRAQNDIPKDTSVLTHHQTTINGQKISYNVYKGTQPVWNKDGKIVATLSYTYYERDGIADKTNRPLSISFNGGPGSASLWMTWLYRPGEGEFRRRRSCRTTLRVKR